MIYGTTANSVIAYYLPPATFEANKSNDSFG